MIFVRLITHTYYIPSWCLIFPLLFLFFIIIALPDPLLVGHCTGDVVPEVVAGTLVHAVYASNIMQCYLISLTHVPAELPSAQHFPVYTTERNNSGVILVIGKGERSIVQDRLYVIRYSKRLRVGYSKIQQRYWANVIF